MVMIGRPAEETVGGAEAMLRAGLYRKSPKPDYLLARHDNSLLAAGKVAWKEGPILAGADSVDITVRGYGGHGTANNQDPILVASEMVVMLQTIVSREMNPLEPTVITVGCFHAGTKHNIIPDDAHLQLTVRTMTPEQRVKALEAIKRVARGVSSAAGVPAEASEDFSMYAREDPKPPTMMFWLGAVDPQKIRDAEEQGTRLPSLHSSEFAPLPAPAIRTGVKAMTTAAEELLKKQ